ncbi:MAG: asparaginase [Pirellulaceae bacterium]
MPGKILIIHTGGTIGMKPTDSGYRPAPGFLEHQLVDLARQWGAQMPAFDVTEYDPLLDSANFCPRDWRRIADDIAVHYYEYEAFLVLHGTDTMAYTASALALMLRGLNKNVILTGSQLPLCLRRNDARENLITGMILASAHSVPEVCVLFGSVLLRGCRATKVSATSFDSFDSPNSRPLGTIGTHIRVFQHRIRTPDTSLPTLKILPLENAAVATLRLFPGIDSRVLENVLQTPLQGLVLEVYGAGNGPSKDAAFLDALRQATERGVVIVSLSQCRHGSVSPTDYATGRALMDAGVVSGRDMTVEAALTKLMFLFSQGLDPDGVRQQIATDLAGELTD